MLGCPGAAADLQAPLGFLAACDNSSVYFHWEKPKAEAVSYKVYCGTDKAKLDQMYVQDGKESTLVVKEFSSGTAFNRATTYYAAVAAVDSNGKETALSDTVIFKPTLSEPKGMSVPMEVQVRILLHTVMSYLY
jgi:fibronectin type 3 domain-containing protein